jgi:hypothetical protein
MRAALSAACLTSLFIAKQPLLAMDAPKLKSVGELISVILL